MDISKKLLKFFCRSKKVDYKDNITIDELFHFGIDHLYTAGYLFTKSPIVQLAKSGDSRTHITLDSAAYLSNVGFEQILKGCLLWETKNFKYVHGVKILLKKLNFYKRSFQI